MHALKSVLKLLFFAAFFIFSVAVGTLAIVWAKPELLLNEANAKRALKQFAPTIGASWNSFTWKFGAEGLLGKAMLLEIGNLCVRKPIDPELDACFRLVKLDLSFSLGISPRITEVRTFLADGDHVTLLNEKSVAEESSSPLPDLRLPSYHSVFPAHQSAPKLTQFELNLEKISVGTRGEVPMVGSVRLSKEPSSDSEISLLLKAKVKKSKALLVSAELSLLAGAQLATIKGMVSGFAAGWSGAIPMEGSWSDSVKLALRPVVQQGARKQSASIELNASPEELILSIGSFPLPPTTWPGRRVKAEACRLVAKLHASEGYPSSNEIRCALSATATGRGALVQTVSGELRAKAILQLSGKRILADIDLDGQSRNDLFQADITGRGQLDFSADWKFRKVNTPDFHADVRVPSFGSLRKALHGSKYEVPAPFSTLDGPIALKADLEKTSEELLPFSVMLDSDLRGSRQSFITRSSAKVLVRDAFSDQRSFEIDASAKLSDVALEAPPLRLESPPQSTLDKRFQTSAESIENLKKSKSNVTWKLRVSTEQNLRIHTNLLEHPIPLAIDLRLSDSSTPSGFVEVRPVPVEVFHRKAQVEHVRLEFRDGATTTEVKGLLLFRNPEVLVRIMILGTTKEPRVVFESDPPLSQQQVVSLLLFNKSVQELNEEEASSSASMSQALADGAFGLFSLMFLSSTPIESVGYDPVSGVYSVRMRVGSKTTVSVASDLEGDRQYALRRRIGKRWAIRTELQKNEDRGNTTLLTLLEWFNRF